MTGESGVEAREEQELGQRPWLRVENVGVTGEDALDALEESREWPGANEYIIVSSFRFDCVEAESLEKVKERILFSFLSHAIFGVGRRLLQYSRHYQWSLVIVNGNCYASRFEYRQVALPTSLEVPRIRPLPRSEMRWHGTLPGFERKSLAH